MRGRNDLPDVVKTSDARLFVDHIGNGKDSADLQTDLTALEDWETKWQMRFRPEKCKSSESTQKGSQEEHPMQATDFVDCNKYLGGS